MFWLRVQLSKLRKLGGSGGQKLRKAGGVDFANDLASLHFILSSNRTQIYLKPIRACIVSRNRGLLKGLGNGLLEAVKDAQFVPYMDPYPSTISRVTVKRGGRISAYWYERR